MKKSQEKYIVKKLCEFVKLEHFLKKYSEVRHQDGLKSKMGFLQAQPKCFITKLPRLKSVASNSDHVYWILPKM